MYCGIRGVDSVIVGIVSVVAIMIRVEHSVVGVVVWSV